MLKINGEEWRLFLTSPNHPALRRSDGTYAIGVCDGAVNTIYVREDLPAELLRKVLAHEITHAAMFSYGIDLDVQQEELLSDLVATYGQEIICNTNVIFRRLKENRGA